MNTWVHVCFVLSWNLSPIVAPWAVVRKDKQSSIKHILNILIPFRSIYFIFYHYRGKNQNILLYGLKGIAAYADHAQILGQEDDKVYSFIHESLDALARNESSLEDWLNSVLKAGEINLKVMELLDTANTGKYGHPVPTKVPLGVKKGKAILVSGHDLKDIEDILKQSEGRGIYVYTHGEMLSCHGYPELKKYKRFYGHYGTAWQNQQKEFAEFPGAIVMTTNCIQKPVESYSDRIFTSGVVSWTGIQRISNGDCDIFSHSIGQASYLIFISHCDV